MAIPRIQHCITPRVLVLGSRFDLTCDYVIARLRALGTPYFRLNTEDLPGYELTLDPIAATCSGATNGLVFSLRADTLQGVYFRQPVFLRESITAGRPVEEQLTRTHWAAFMRSLMVFRNCRWINPPGATYTAEHKALQLSVAAELGFAVPHTVITNSGNDIDRVAAGATSVAVKGLDTVLLRDGDSEAFGYTRLLDCDELRRHELQSAPFILQNALRRKLDLRVTVVGDRLWAVDVVAGGQPINGDWRIAKGAADFRRYDLPGDVADRCVALVSSLGLVFGAIDLALQDGTYYFLEINPTGEWGWLADGLDLPIAEAIATYLTGEDR